jgi:hypothetical protein
LLKVPIIAGGACSLRHGHDVYAGSKYRDTAIGKLSVAAQ